MEVTEDENFQKNAKQCKHCLRMTLLSYEHEFTCISCSYNVIKRKTYLSKTSRKKIGFIVRLKYAEQEIFCIFTDVYRLYESDDFKKIMELYPTWKTKN